MLLLGSSNNPVEPMDKHGLLKGRISNIVQDNNDIELNDDLNINLSNIIPNSIQTDTQEKNKRKQ